MLFQFYYGGYGGLGATLQRFGIFDVFIPFLLVFSIIFSVLKKIEIFKTGGDRINIIVAASIAGLFVAPHIGGTTSYYYLWFGMDPVAIINNVIPQVAVIIVALTMALIAAGLGGWDADLVKGKSVIGWASFAIVIFYFLVGMGFFQNFLGRYLPFLLDPGFYSLIIILAMFAFLINWMAGTGGTS